MDDSLQFIIESPQHSQGHKKRPRLVTSCDNCRMKKIKCIQPSPETRCEACRAAKVTCKFRDRERYFAERSRAIAGGTPSPSYGDSRTHPDNRGPVEPSGSPAYSPRTIHSARHSRASSNGSSRYSYSPDSRSSHSPEFHHRQASLSSLPSMGARTAQASAFGYQPPSPQAALHPHRQSPSSLFDSSRPQFPNPSLMPQLIQLFFQELGGNFLFLSLEDTLRDQWDRSLPPLLSNCIAAMGARFTTQPELVVRGLDNAVEAFAANAKMILSSVAHIASMDSLHAIILLAWFEYNSERTAAFNSYTQMAMKMGMDLGLSDQRHSLDQVHATDSDQLRRTTWQSIMQLHVAGSAPTYTLS